jgi:hypothetical protein
MSKYKKGTFITLPNKQVIKGMSPEVQSVYMWIVDFSNDDGICFPSKKALSLCSGVSIRKVFDCIRQLEEKGILVKENRKEGKKNLTNIYQIMEVELEEGSAPRAIPSAPCAIGGSAPRAERTQPNIELNLLNSSDENIAKGDIDKFIDLFKDISPMNYKKWFGQPPQRKASEELLKIASLDKYENLIRDVLPKLNLIPYVSKDCKAFSPWELQKNFDKIRAKWIELGNKEKQPKHKPIEIIQ